MPCSTQVRAVVVKIEVKHVDNQIELRLADNGCGLDEAHCELFLRYSVELKVTVNIKARV